jgi:hypothetical protein
MRLFAFIALGAACSVAVAEAQRPPDYPSSKAPASLRESPVDQPAHPLVLAAGDFDGDGQVDTVERVPGARRNSLRIQVRLAARADNPYFITEGSPASMVEATEVKVGRAGVYMLTKTTRNGDKVTREPDPVAMPHDVVLVRLERPPWRGYMLKYWSEPSDSFYGVSWPDPESPPVQGQ